MKPIKLTPELVEQAKEKFNLYLKGLKMSDGKISYAQTFSYDAEDKVYLSFSYMAFAKMLTLISSYSTEIAWHGMGKKLTDSEYYIEDIVVYPQRVTGAHVDMDIENYPKWMYANIENPAFKKICLQGHSHVSMSPSPSSVDLGHQKDILDDLGNKGFYIFIIMNKRLEHDIRIYDLDVNTMYETDDIILDVYDTDDSMSEFLQNTKKVVKTITYNSPKENFHKESKFKRYEEYGDDEDDEAVIKLYEELYGHQHDDSADY